MPPDDSQMPSEGQRPEPNRAEPGTPPIGRDAETGDVHLIYKIEGSRDEVPIFELARTLEALGTVVQEADRVIHHDPHKLVVTVKPFQEGSFLMDLPMYIQSNPAFLFFLSQPEAIERIKTVLEYLGLIKKGKEAIATVREVVEFLRNGRPEKVIPAGSDKFNYVNNNGQELAVSGTVHSLVNNVTIQNFYFPAVAEPLQRTGVEGLSTYLKEAPEQTRMFLPKDDVPAIQAYSQPEPDPPRVEVIENVTTEFLNPKAGTYGDPEGTWTFTRAGTKTRISARITDEKFLGKFQRGAVRFYQNDLLKVRLRQEQTLKAGKVKVRNEIIEVQEYNKAPVQRSKKPSD